MALRDRFSSRALALAAVAASFSLAGQALADGPVKVFIMMGQSNMVGLGNVTGNTDGTLDYAVNTEGLYPYLSDGNGGFASRSDVRQAHVQGSGGPGANTSLLVNDWLSGDNRNKLGPELGIGEMLGNAIDQPVLLLKSVIGNRSLGWDLLPPGSTQYPFNDNGTDYTYAGYGDSPERWVTGTTPQPVNWQAGLQYDGDVARAKNVLAEFETYYPGQTEYEVAGFFWWQGDKDRYNAGHAARYEQNLVRLVEQLRVEFDAPNAPFVAATLGQSEIGVETGTELQILNAQLAIDGDTGSYPLFKDNTSTVYSYPLSLGGASNSHYNGNAKTYMNIGEAMGAAMVDLLENSPYVEVDRQTGEVKIVVPATASGDLDLRDYALGSAAGALVGSGWDPIAGNYDAAGDGSVDSGLWSVLTNSVTELSESAVPGGADGLIAAGSEVSLGAGVWLQNAIEDITFTYTDTGDLPRSLQVRYVGNRAGLGDLDFDGSVTAADWVIFISNAQADMSGLTAAQTAQAGDLDGDGDNDIYDFALFREAYEADNPAPGAFEAMVASTSVPEPGSLAVLGLGGLGLLRRRG
ncbi:MAG: sialate O-acetylesterase [Phycisphaeraceae bacterium]